MMTLSRALYINNIKLIKAVLDAGADVHEADDWALRWAATMGHTEVVKLLKKAGAT